MGATLGTGLDKNYDFKLEFLPPLPPGVNKENLRTFGKAFDFRGLRQQLDYHSVDIYTI